MKFVNLPGRRRFLVLYSGTPRVAKPGQRFGAIFGNRAVAIFGLGVGISIFW